MLFGVQAAFWGCVVNVITAWAASAHPTQIRAACVCFCVSVIECFVFSFIPDKILLVVLRQPEMVNRMGIIPFVSISIQIKRFQAA